MRITVNGTEQTIDRSLTVAELLARHDLAGRPAAVEVNGEVVRRAEHASRSLADGDKVEIVTLVGGG